MKQIDNKGISYWYAIISLTFIIIGAVIGILANMGIFEQTINSGNLPLFNTYVVGSIIAFILVIIGVLILVFGHRS